jgi:hypothetical protein
MPARPWRNLRPRTVEDIPIWVNVLGPCTHIGHALGLAVDLPNLVDRTEPEALLRLPTDTWKDAFEGSVADTLRHGDRGWLRLADYGFGSAFFDVEEGIKFSTTVANLGECLAFIVSLADFGVKLWDPELMQGFGGEFGACVWLTQALVGRVPDAGTAFESMGLVRGGPDALAPWMMPPGWVVPNRPGASPATG